GRRQRPQEIAEVVGERMKLEPHRVGGERSARQSRPLDRAFALTCCKAWARVPAGIANARARSVAAPIANREQQKSTAEGRKCGQVFSVERENARDSSRVWRENAQEPPDAPIYIPRHKNHARRGSRKRPGPS